MESNGLIGDEQLAQRVNQHKDKDKNMLKTVCMFNSFSALEKIQQMEKEIEQSHIYVTEIEKSKKQLEMQEAQLLEEEMKKQ